MIFWSPPSNNTPSKNSNSSPPLLRRLTSRNKSYSDLAITGRLPSLSRGNSKHSDRTVVDVRPPKSEKHFRYDADLDALLLERLPPLPPKDSGPPRLPLPSCLLEPTQKLVAKPEVRLEGAVAQESVGTSLPKPKPHPGSEDSEPEYPWYRRRLHLPPDSTPKPRASQSSLFPRTDFAVSASRSSHASLSLFGGLVNERAQNDAYTISVKDQSLKQLKTFGDVPTPRFGQASAFAGSVVVVWGGDATSASCNQLRASVKYDNALYFLNLVSREWTCIHVTGAAPHGRIGHSVVMIGPKVYVFGGEADGEYFNDLWCFDLSTLVSKPRWQQIELPKGVTDRPSPRSAHICVAYKDQLVIFGGIDGKSHYNDTWVFDTMNKAWSELACTGYIPSQREGHAAALVDDIMYVFGGRGVDGANIGQLAAFKITSKRWFMFQNMGPEPSARSGHGMAAIGSRVYVLGGVCEDDLAASEGKESNFVYILDTDYIRYPSTTLWPPHESKLVA